MKRSVLYQLLFVMICTMLPMITFAQLVDPNDAPIDGGLSLLLAAGVGYGVKKYRDRKKEHAEDETPNL